MVRLIDHRLGSLDHDRNPAVSHSGRLPQVQDSIQMRLDTDETARVNPCVLLWLDGVRHTSAADAPVIALY